ncbi:MAG TPA: HpsJ family protein [Nostocaceae cyanobacterium]|nr:HpsJ family protein [Nostocaceae cyanobacterium]
MVNRFTPANTSLALKTIGVICLLSFLLDFIFIAFPFQPTDRPWLINLCRNLVERGVVPLVGIGFLLVGFSIDSTEDNSRSQGVNLKLPAFILSSILGLMFFIIAPLHAINVNQFKTQTLAQNETQATQLENQVRAQAAQTQSQINNEQAKAAIERQKAALKEQFGAQLEQIVKNDQEYNRFINNNQTPPELRELVKQYKADPKVLDDFIARLADPQQLATQRITQIRTQKEQRIQRTQEDAGKEVRVAISSFLLSIAFVIIGLSGLKSLGAAQGGSSKRKAPAR